MLLAVDIGNTSTKFGIFRGKELHSKFFLPTTDDTRLLEQGLAPKLDPTVSEAIVCSVVPDATHALLEFLSQKQIPANVVTNRSAFGLTINYAPTDSLGTDRLVNSFAVAEKYGVPAIVCSFGTATTIDVIDRDRRFLGGVIAPGVKTAAGSLRSSTSLLPEVAIEKPVAVIGTSTPSAILSGVVWGHAAMVEGLIRRLSDELDDQPRVIATGGFAPLMESMTAIIDVCDPDLTLTGLMLLSLRTAGTAVDDDHTV